MCDCNSAMPAMEMEKHSLFSSGSKMGGPKYPLHRSLFGFSTALYRAKMDCRYVRRRSWREELFIYAGDVNEESPHIGLIMEGEEWLPTTADLFAQDWEEASRYADETVLVATEMNQPVER